MNFKMLRLIVAVGCFATLSGNAQTPVPMPADAHPKFEIATIKPSDPADSSRGFQTRGRHLFIKNQNLSTMFAFAYGIHETQIVGAPGWFTADRFDVDALPDVEGYPNIKQYQEMVKQLLSDRFHIRVHQEKRQLTIYLLTVSKGGSKLVKSTHDPKDPTDQTGNGVDGIRFMRFTNNNMTDFALGMQSLLDRPVVDHTGLKERYDFVLRWTPESVEAPPADAPPGMFTAVQDELGLKLAPTKGKTDVYVMDHVERPSEN